MIYRVTFGFEGQGKGWSETHAVQAQSTEPSALVPGAIAIAQKRVTFLGREFSINAIRIARYSDDGATTRMRGTVPINRTFKNPDQTVKMAAEPAVVALLARGETNAAVGAPPALTANINQTFLGAPPDDAVNNGGDVDPGKSNLGANYAQWAALIVQNRYGWLASNTIADLEIDTITQRLNGTVEFDMVGPVGGGLVIGRTYPARVRRVNAGVSPLNGQIILRYVAPNTFVSQEIIGLALAQTGGFIRVYQPIAPFIPFSNLTLQDRTARHKRGRPFGSTPGRARNRVRG